MKKNLIYGVLFAFILSLSLVSSAQWNQELNDGLIHYWTLDETSSSALDSVGDSDSTGFANSTVGIIGNGISSDGSTDMYFDPAIEWENYQNHSISFWINNTGDPSTYPIIVHTPQSSNFMFSSGDCLGYSNAYRVFVAGVCTSIDASLLNLEWNHIVITFSDGGDSEIYINGNLQYTFTSGSFSGLGGTLYISSIDILNNAWVIDEIALWGKRLTEDNVESLFALGEAMQYTNESTPEPNGTVTASAVVVSPTENQVVTSNPFNIVCNYNFTGTTNATIYLEVRYLNGTVADTQSEVTTTSPYQEAWDVDLVDASYQTICTIVANETTDVSDVRHFSVNTTVITPPTNGGLNDVECDSDDTVCNSTASLGAGLGVFFKWFLYPLVFLIVIVMFVGFIAVILKTVSQVISESIKRK